MGSRYSLFGPPCQTCDVTNDDERRTHARVVVNCLTLYMHVLAYVVACTKGSRVGLQQARQDESSIEEVQALVTHLQERE